MTIDIKKKTTKSPENTFFNISMRSGVTFQYVAPLCFSITYQNSLFKQVSLNEALNASADNRVLTCTCTLLFGWTSK